MRTRRVALGVVVTLAMGGCGASAPPEETRTTVADEGKTWDQMSFDERRRYMARRVLPEMAALFEEYDAERFSGFGCESCHGEDMQARGFAMPNPEIMALHPTGTEEQRRMVEEYRPMVMFMFNRVLPRMQELLNAPPYDEATGTGFSCFACHPHAAEPSGTTSGPSPGVQPQGLGEPIAPG